MKLFVKASISNFDTGTIRVQCPYCGTRNKVEVTFPAYNKPFNTVITECPECGEEYKVYDSHKYNKDGTIIR